LISIQIYSSEGGRLGGNISSNLSASITIKQKHLLMR